MTSRIRLIAGLFGIFCAGVTYGLLSLRNISICGSPVCGEVGLLVLRHYIIALALPMTVGYLVALFTLAALSERRT